MSSMFITGGGSAALIAQRVRQISYNTFVTQTAIQLNAVTATLIFIGAADNQYSCLFMNLDTTNDIALGGDNVTFAGGGIRLPANIAVTFDNPNSRILLQPVQFGNQFVGLAVPGLFGIASAGTPWLQVFIFRAANDGNS